MASQVSIEELKKALKTLDDALKFSQKSRADDVQFKIARDACIQRFEYCIELAWKVSMKKLGSTIQFPKPAVREMARADLIQSAEKWLDFVEARNNSSHSYDEDVAAQIFSQIIVFYDEANLLIERLQKLA